MCCPTNWAFRDRYEVFREYGAEVFGLHSENEISHKKFAEKLYLPYPLLSDKGGRVRRLYAMPKTMGFLPGRVTFLIDKQGVVRHIFNSQLNLKGHIEEAYII